ncbi:MAG: hypothetical protein D6729_01155 [Deltaproteobacteria bacterium]|nr:MAG: hypothetical protein D6729_01155 [Deltaproteobacteria bacterium]
MTLRSDRDRSEEARRRRRRNLALLAVIAGAAVLGGLLFLFSQTRLRALYGASADALAGTEAQAPAAEGEAPAEAPRVESAPLSLPAPEAIWIFGWSTGAGGNAERAPLRLWSSVGALTAEPPRLGVEVYSHLATVEWKQRFRNTSEQGAEISAALSLPNPPMLLDFELVVGERRIRGIVRERKEAERLYEQAVAAGLPVAYGRTEEEATIESLLHLPPGGSVEVVLRDLRLPGYERGRFTLDLPRLPNWIRYVGVDPAEAKGGRYLSWPAHLPSAVRSGDYLSVAVQPQELGPLPVRTEAGTVYPAWLPARRVNTPVLIVARATVPLVLTVGSEHYTLEHFERGPDLSPLFHWGEVLAAAEAGEIAATRHLLEAHGLLSPYTSVIVVDTASTP